jgi:hypothetical protein
MATRIFSLEFLSVLLVLVGVALVAVPRIEGQYLMVTAQVAWAVFAYKNKLWGLLFQSVLLFGMSAYAVMSWTTHGIG